MVSKVAAAKVQTNKPKTFSIEISAQARPVTEVLNYKETIAPAHTVPNGLIVLVFSGLTVRTFNDSGVRIVTGSEAEGSDRQLLNSNLDFLQAALSAPVLSQHELNLLKKKSIVGFLRILVGKRRNWYPESLFLILI